MTRFKILVTNDQGELLEQFEVTQEDLDSRKGLELVLMDVRDEILRAQVNYLTED